MEQVYDFLAETDDGVYVVDRDQRIVLWNAAASRVLGFEPDEVIGRHCYEVVGGTDDSGCDVCCKNCATMLAVARRELVPTREARVQMKSGARAAVNVTTILLPSRWRALSVLAHLFRRVEDRAPRDRADAGSLLESVKEPRRVPGAPDEPPSTELEPLTPREGDVLNLLACGASTEVIANRLCIGRTTVRTHVQRVLEKLNVHSRLEAVTFGQRNGLV